MPSELKPTTAGDRKYIADVHGDRLTSSDETVMRLLADLERRDAVLKRVALWDKSWGYLALGDIQADARKMLQ